MIAVARGFLSGALWGVVVAVVGAGALSVLSVGRDGTGVMPAKPEATALEVPAGSEFNQAREDGAASLPSSEPVAKEAAVPKVLAPEPDDLGSLAGVITNPGAQPDAGAAPDGMDQPDTEPGVVPELDMADDRPVVLETAQSAPQAPAGEAELSISTEPAQPIAPPVETEETILTETAPEPEPEPKMADPVISEAQEAPTAPAPNVLSDAPDEPSAPVVEDSALAGAPEPAEVSETPSPVMSSEGPAKPDADPEIEETLRVETAPAEPRADAVEVEQESVAQADPAEKPIPQIQRDESAPEPGTGEGAVIEEAPEAQPEQRVAGIRVGTPGRTLTSRDDNRVNTGRLPSVQAGGQTAVAASLNGAELPPVKRFAIDVQTPEDKPKMAIVLMDEATGPMPLETLSAFPYPLSIAVDTSREDAGEKMKAYREAGFEVLAMVSLPEGAAPRDVEVALPVLLERVPEAVAVMEAPGDGLQKDRKVSDQVARILADTGHGLLLFPKGLNTAQKLAAKNGVPSATVFRDFDGGGQNARAIRRFLGNGALKAGTEGGVVMVGRLRPDTVNALLVWGLDERAGQIALVPVSQLLQPQN